MQILLTGATGFVGTRLVPQLLAGGHALSVLSRDAARASRKLPGEVRAFSWDHNQDEVPREACEGAEAVINLMGESIAGGRWTEARKQRIYSSRAAATQKLVAALPTTVRTLVSASALGYYPSSKDVVYDESFERESADDFMGHVVVDWEQAATAAASGGRRVVLLRIGLVLGDEGILGKLVPIFKLGLGGPIGDGRAWVSWIHVDDVVRLIEFCLSAQISGPVNVAAPGAVRFSEFARTLGSVLHRPAVLPVPEFALKLLYGEAAAVPLSSQHIVPKAAHDAGFEFRHSELKPALTEILRG